METRLLTKDEAASYCRLGLSAFAKWVADGRLPGPIPATHRWDRKALDLALDKASGINANMPSAYDQWKAERNVRGA